MSAAVSSRDTTSSACLASVLLRGQPGGKVVHDPRLTWNTIEVVKASGGVSVLSKSGHAFIKQRMREVDGVYGGEMSAHHYFRRFAYCDSGMIPWLIVAQILCESGLRAVQLVGERIGLFPVSGELNYRVPDAKAAIAAFEARYAPQAMRPRPHRRRVLRVRGLALQFAQLEYRALDTAQRRGARFGGSHARQNRGIAGAAEIAGRGRGGSLNA